MHRLLQNQFKRVLGLPTAEAAEPVLAELRALAGSAGLSPEAARALDGLPALFARISQSYDQADRDLTLRARSLQLSSEELADANERLRREAAAQAHAIHRLRGVANSLLRADGRPELPDSARRRPDRRPGADEPADGRAGWRSAPRRSGRWSGRNSPSTSMPSSASPITAASSPTPTTNSARSAASPGTNCWATRTGS